MKILALMVLVAAGTTTVSGLQCYMCASLVTPGCADPFSKDGVANATCSPLLGVQSYCYKATTKAKQLSGVTRQCLPDTTNIGFKCSDVNAYGVSASVCYCNTDFCNGAGQHMAPAFAVAVGIMLTIIGMELPLK